MLRYRRTIRRTETVKCVNTPLGDVVQELEGYSKFEEVDVTSKQDDLDVSFTRLETGLELSARISQERKDAVAAAG
jgi:hypothetical protein